jgi:glycosyltransferase involved in cell wall biosynthesis
MQIPELINGMAAELIKDDGEKRERPGRADMSPILSIIIPVRDDPKNLKRCLASLLAADHPSGGMEIIVGDNGGGKECADIAAHAGAKVIKLPRMNVASVRNGAAKHARGLYLAFIDADHTIEPGWMKAAIDIFNQPNTGAAGAPYSTPQSGTWVQRSYDRFRQRPGEIRPVEWLGSGNLIVRSEVFNEINGFDTSLETCEDVDLCGRIRKAGYFLLANPAMGSVHWGDPATLKAVFRGELWRGRSNLQVSFRKPYTLRNLVSAFIPLGNLASFLISILAAILYPHLWIVCIFVPVIFWILSITLRFARMREKNERFSLITAVHNLAVAAVFEAGRALALVMHSNHRRRSR